jgi:polysaccharide export outer membrane protein
MTRQLISFLFFLLFAIFVGSFARSQTSEQLPRAAASGMTNPPADIRAAAASEQPPALRERNPRYQLTPGDSIDINFKFSPELNQKDVHVQPDGFITLADIGDIHVAGLTLPEAREKLTASYSKVLKDPAIEVDLRDFNKPYFIASGRLLRPGKYELREATTLTEAIAIAGGFNDTSKHSQVWLFRREPNGSIESREFNVKKMLAKGKLQEDIPLQPGDMIWVPQNEWSKVQGVLMPSAGVVGAAGGVAARYASPGGSATGSLGTGILCPTCPR